jgi:hypothetical protein
MQHLDFDVKMQQDFDVTMQHDFDVKMQHNFESTCSDCAELQACLVLRPYLPLSFSRLCENQDEVFHVFYILKF